jgi:4-amino-4-deoxy-L-arabinose transferase-like glycosyltransferase
MDWGLPYSLSWAPDELPLLDVLQGLRQGFSGGWHRPYPPVHYYLLGILVAPFEVSERAGLTNVLAGPAHTTLILLFRGVSVGMTVGTVYLVYRCGVDLHRDRRAGVLGAALAASMPIVVFYSGLANLEAPYLFWFTLALFFFVRSVRNPLGPDLVGFAVAATLAVCTKDQAYGYFVLPAAYALWLRYAARSPRSTATLLTDRVVGKAALGSVAAFVVGQNLLFNFQGFLGHVQHIVSMSTYPPTYAQSLAGHVGMVGEAFRQLSWSMGWPSLVVGAAVQPLVGTRRAAAP